VKRENNNEMNIFFCFYHGMREPCFICERKFKKYELNDAFNSEAKKAELLKCSANNNKCILL
jgi:hypothetical protein